MHEMALTESIVEIAVETARREGAARVRKVFVDVGALSSVEPEALMFCFAAVSAGTIAEGATLRSPQFPAPDGAWTAARPCRSRSASAPVRTAAGSMSR